jgi:hypothetical protein
MSNVPGGISSRVGMADDNIDLLCYDLDEPSTSRRNYTHCSHSFPLTADSVRNTAPSFPISLPTVSHSQAAT